MTSVELATGKRQPLPAERDARREGRALRRPRHAGLRRPRRRPHPRRVGRPRLRQPHPLPRVAAARRRHRVGRRAHVRAEPPSSVTYSNLHRLVGERGRIYNFFRGLDNRFKPSVAWSDDERRELHERRRRDRRARRVPAPALRQVRLGRATRPSTSRTPRGTRATSTTACTTSIYRGGVLHRSDGTRDPPARRGPAGPGGGHARLPGRPANVAWVADSSSTRRAARSSRTRSRRTRPACRPARGARTTAIGSRAGRARPGIDREIAYAGTRLYAGRGRLHGRHRARAGRPDPRLRLDGRRPGDRRAARERRRRQAALGDLPGRDGGRAASAGAGRR